MIFFLSLKFIFLYVHSQTAAEAACGGASIATDTCKNDYCLTLDDSVAAESAGQESGYNEENAARGKTRRHFSIIKHQLFCNSPFI